MTEATAAKYEALDRLEDKREMLKRALIRVKNGEKYADRRAQRCAERYIEAIAREIEQEAT